MSIRVQFGEKCQGVQCVSETRRNIRGRRDDVNVSWLMHGNLQTLFLDSILIWCNSILIYHIERNSKLHFNRDTSFLKTKSDPKLRLIICPWLFHTHLIEEGEYSRISIYIPAVLFLKMIFQNYIFHLHKIVLIKCEGS